MLASPPPTHTYIYIYIYMCIQHLYSHIYSYIYGSINAIHVQVCGNIVHLLNCFSGKFSQCSCDIDVLVCDVLCSSLEGVYIYIYICTYTYIYIYNVYMCILILMPSKIVHMSHPFIIYILHLYIYSHWVYSHRACPSMCSIDSCLSDSIQTVLCIHPFARTQIVKALL